MGLYERLGGFDPATNGEKISVHAFMSAMQEYMLGNMSPVQATAAFGLSAGEQIEALALRDRILVESSANANLARRMKALEFENVLLLLENRIAPFDNAAAVKTRLGV